MQIFTDKSNADCDQCGGILDELENIDDDCDRHGITFVKTQDYTIAELYGISEYPVLVYFEGNVPNVYEGSLKEEEEVLQWLIQQKTEDRIELITRVMLETMVEETQYLAVYFCKSPTPTSLQWTVLHAFSIPTNIFHFQNLSNNFCWGRSHAASHGSLMFYYQILNVIQALLISATFPNYVRCDSTKHADGAQCNFIFSIFFDRFSLKHFFDTVFIFFVFECKTCFLNVTFASFVYIHTHTKCIFMSSSHPRHKIP